MWKNQFTLPHAYETISFTPTRSVHNGKNLEQERYTHMIETMNDISDQVCYDITYCNNVRTWGHPRWDPLAHSVVHG